MKTAHLDIRVEQSVVDKIDEWRNRQPVPPSRAATIIMMIEQWFDAEQEVQEQRKPLQPAARR